jgi:hypothetical protein
MRETRIMFSHLLPVVDLALLVVLVFVPITLMCIRLYEASAGSNQVHVHTDQSDMSLPRDQIVPIAIRMVTVSKARTMMAINLPGSLIQGLISLPSRSSSPSGWHPQALALETWQALVFPFFALPFWWLVGRGLDAIVSKERLHWWLLLIGTLLSGLCLAGHFHLDPNAPPPEQDGSYWIFIGLTGWAIAFAILPIAWITQSIRQRRNPPASPDATL